MNNKTTMEKAKIITFQTIVELIIFLLPMLPTYFVEPIHEGLDKTQYSQLYDAYMVFVVILLITSWAFCSYKLAEYITVKIFKTSDDSID